jgi:hypothetical protein
MRREGGSVLPQTGGRLFQQYCVDAYCKMEAQRLHWVRHNQKTLRSEEYNVFKEWQMTQSAGGAAADGTPRVGRPVVLPSSFSGSPRAMHMNYHDAMAIVRKHGKPDYFITFTANPAWPEIADNLWPETHAANRPDIVARVFDKKFEALLTVLLEGCVLGVPVAYAWTIEFQKRGLPHAHLLLVVRAQDKPRTPADVDSVVSAELPDATDPQQRCSATS